MAETYGIFDLEAYKPSFIALLAVNLRPDSRVKMRLAGLEITMQELLLAVIADKLANIAWMFSEDGAKRQNKPKSITAILTGKEDENNPAVVGYDTPEDFMKAMEKYK